MPSLLMLLGLLAGAPTEKATPLERWDRAVFLATERNVPEDTPTTRRAAGHRLIHIAR